MINSSAEGTLFIDEKTNLSRPLPTALVTVSELRPLALPCVVERVGHTTVSAAEEIFLGKSATPRRAPPAFML